MKKDKIAVIIPARFGSTRLEGKPLIEVEGKTIIQHVYEKVCQSKLAEKIIIATDDQRIYETARSFGANAEMTCKNHPSGSDRIAEVIKRNKDIKIAINVQGDEPLIRPETIDRAIESLQKDDCADISTPVRVIEDENQINNPNIVKAVFDNNNNALYFSRSPIPYHRNTGESKTFAHVGLYGYKREALLKMTSLEKSNLELSESLEQLRALQNGMKIKTFEIDYNPIGIDTKEDIEEFKNHLENIK